MGNRRTGRKRELSRKLQSDDVEVNLLPSQRKGLACSKPPSKMAPAASTEQDTIMVRRGKYKESTGFPTNSPGSGERRCRGRSKANRQAQQAESQTSPASNTASTSRSRRATVTRSRSSTLFADTPASSSAGTSRASASLFPTSSPSPSVRKAKNSESSATSTPAGVEADMSPLKRGRGDSSAKRGRGRPRKHPPRLPVSSIPASSGTPDPVDDERASSITSVSGVPAKNTRSKTPLVEPQRTTQRRQVPRLRPSTDAEHNARIQRAIEYCKNNPVKGNPHHPDTIKKAEDEVRKMDRAIEKLALEPAYPLGWETDKVRIAQLVEARGVSFSAQADVPVSTDVPMDFEVRNDNPTVPPPFIDWNERDIGMDPVSDMWIMEGKSQNKQRTQREYPDKILADAGLPRFADLNVRIQIEMIENLFHQGHWGFTHLELAFKIRLADLLAIRQHIVGIQARRAVLEGLIPMTNELYQNPIDGRSWDEIYDDNKASLDEFIVQKGIDCYSLHEAYQTIPMSERQKALDFVTAWQLSRNYLGHTMPGEGLGWDLSGFYWDEFVNSFAAPAVDQTASSTAQGQSHSHASSSGQPNVPRMILTPQSQKRKSQQTVGLVDSTPMKGRAMANTSHTRPSSYKAQLAAGDMDSDSDLPRMRTDSPDRPKPIVSLASLARSAPVAPMGSSSKLDRQGVNFAQAISPSPRPASGGTMQFQQQTQHQQSQTRGSYDSLGPMIG